MNDDAAKRPRVEEYTSDGEEYNEDWQTTKFNQAFLDRFEALQAERRSASSLNLNFAVTGRLEGTAPGIVISKDSKSERVVVTLLVLTTTLNTLISDYSTMAAFGKGSNTVIDPAVRMTHSIVAASVSFQTRNGRRWCKTCAAPSWPRSLAWSYLFTPSCTRRSYTAPVATSSRTRTPRKLRGCLGQWVATNIPLIV